MRRRQVAPLRSLPSVYWLLHRLGYSYLRPRPRHRQADPEALAEFQRSWPDRLAAIAAEHPGERLRVYFQDESRFGQQGTTTNVWAKRGSRPTAIRQTEYEYLWVLGAVCPETGHAEGLLSPQLNTKIVNTFLQLFSRTIPEHEHAVMIWDGAGFHTAKALQVPTNITVVQLPPYAPELNPTPWVGGVRRFSSMIRKVVHWRAWKTRHQLSTLPASHPGDFGERESPCRCSSVWWR